MQAYPSNKAVVKDEDEFARTLIRECRYEVDAELNKIREALELHAWTPERAEQMAIRAAHEAKVLTKAEIKQELINDAKMEIANASIGIMRNAAKVVSLFIVGLAFWMASHKWPWE